MISRKDTSFYSTVVPCCPPPQLSSPTTVLPPYLGIIISAVRFVSGSCALNNCARLISLPWPQECLCSIVSHSTLPWWVLTVIRPMWATGDRDSVGSTLLSGRPRPRGRAETLGTASWKRRLQNPVLKVAVKQFFSFTDFQCPQPCKMGATLDDS